MNLHMNRQPIGVHIHTNLIVHQWRFVLPSGRLPGFPSAHHKRRHHRHKGRNGRQHGAQQDGRLCGGRAEARPAERRRRIAHCGRIEEHVGGRIAAIAVVRGVVARHAGRFVRGVVRGGDDVVATHWRRRAGRLVGVAGAAERRDNGGNANDDEGGRCVQIERH